MNLIKYFVKGGIHLTQVTTRCSIWGHGGLPPDAYRIRGALFDRGCLPPIRLPASVAGGIRLPSVQWSSTFETTELPTTRCSGYLSQVNTPFFVK